MRFPLLSTLIAPHAGAGPHVAPSIQAAHHEAGVDARHAASRSLHGSVDLLVLGQIPSTLRSALDAHYTLHDALDIDARHFRAIIASTGTVIDADLMARLRGLRIIVLLGPHPGHVDLGAATSHSIRVALIGEDHARAAHVALANLDACFRGQPLPSAIV